MSQIGVNGVGARRQACKNACEFNLSASYAKPSGPSTALRPAQRAAALRHGVDEMAHFWMLRLDVDGQAVRLQGFAADRADRGEDDPAGGGHDVVQATETLRGLNDVVDLSRAGEQRHIDAAIGKLRDR